MFLSSLAVLVFALGLTGCPSGGGSDQPASPPQVGGTGEHAGHEHAEHTEAMSAGSDVQAALAKLSEEDRALAAAQKTCPVSDEPLGSMGTPVKVTVKGRDVFLCCPGCEGEIKADPDKYLAKLE
ncbi:MAG: hypothetical protein A2V98_01125 [Planctomycetes bacterium RBG_16_64_12]|nr:MAG: hypothetical protein A2V98_01125 [Planctomycetes bacterium RBG_16_64_12]